MSNMIILMGSVRKGGNTDLLVQAFAEGARRNNTVEIISVADYRVNPCIGCNSCSHWRLYRFRSALPTT